MTSSDPSQALRSDESERTIAAKLSRDMFSSEREILIQAHRGREVTALVDERSVVEPRRPAAGESINGRVKVFVVEMDKGSGHCTGGFATAGFCTRLQDQGFHGNAALIAPGQEAAGDAAIGLGAC
jgi:hypothetical protein